MYSQQEPARPLTLVSKESFEIDANFIEQANQAKSLMRALAEFIDGLNDDYLNVEPWCIFRVWQDMNFEPKSIHSGVFRAWQAFFWMPDPSTVNVPFLGSMNKTLAEVFLCFYRSKLTESQVSMIMKASSQAPDFCELVSRANDGTVVLYRLLSQTKIVCYDLELDNRMNVGDIVFGQFVPVDEDRYLSLGVGQIFPSKVKKDINDLNNTLFQTDKNKVRRFSEIESDILNLYYDLCEWCKPVEP